MQLSSPRVRRSAIAAMVVGVLLIAAVVIMGLRGGSDDDPLSSREDLTGSQGLQPFDTGLADTERDRKGTKRSSGSGPTSVLGQGGPDPFATSSGDNTLHKVRITFTSDGGMYAGWRYRTKGGEGLQTANRTLTVTRQVRGGLPVAQAAVQVLGTATYATCTVYVDGVAVIRQTAKGANHVTVCVG